jgi:hypothetical protein
MAQNRFKEVEGTNGEASEAGLECGVHSSARSRSRSSYSERRARGVRKGIVPLAKYCTRTIFENLEVVYGTQYHPTVVQWYYRFFPMGTMVIWLMCIIWKQFGICRGVILHL